MTWKYKKSHKNIDPIGQEYYESSTKIKQHNGNPQSRLAYSNIRYQFIWDHLQGGEMRL